MKKVAALRKMSSRKAKRETPLQWNELPLTTKEKAILKHLRLAFREVAGKAGADRIGKLTVLAFRHEFPNAKSENALANAYVRAIPSLRKMLADEGGSINAAETAKRLGVSRTTVMRHYREKRLVGWRDYYGAEVKFPCWQFTENGLLAGFDKVMEVFRSAKCLDDIGVILFFVSQYDAFGGQRPLDCLREGNVNEAVRIADAHVS
jgi:hypothetical protein